MNLFMESATTIQNVELARLSWTTFIASQGSQKEVKKYIKELTALKKKLSSDDLVRHAGAFGASVKKGKK